MTFPKLEDWKAPWEKDGAEIDPEKAKSFAYSIKKTAYDDAEKAKTDLKEAADALAVYKKAEEDAARENETVTDKLQREIKELGEKLGKASGTTRDTLVLEVALEKKLTKKQALRLSGDTLEELLADADEYLKDLGPAKEADPEDPPADDGITIRRSPNRVRTPGDPDWQAPPDTNVAEAIKLIPRF